MSQDKKRKEDVQEMYDLHLKIEPLLDGVRDMIIFAVFVRILWQIEENVPGAAKEFKRVLDRFCEMKRTQAREAE